MTKRILQEALLEMLADKPVEMITVKALCERADINRSTFYAHYDGVFRLFQEMCDTLSEDIKAHVQNMSTKTTDVQQIELLLEYIKSHATICSRLLFNKYHLNDSQRIINRVEEETLSHISSLYPVIEPVYRDYIMNYLIVGSNSMIVHWIEQGFDLDVNTLARMIYRFSSSVMDTVVSYDQDRPKP